MALVPRSQTTPSGHSGASRPPIPPTLLGEPFNERHPRSNVHGNKVHPAKRVLKKVSGRSPTPFPDQIGQGSSQYSPPSVPFDLVSRTRYISLDGSRNHCDPLRSPSYTSLMSSVSLRSSNASPQSSPLPSPSRSRNFKLLSRPCTPQTASTLSQSGAFSSSRLPASMSLQDLSPASNLWQPSPSSSHSPPSSPRSITSRVPGLEHRVRPSRSRPALNDNTRGHVPYGTLRF